jgi:hypothetical protein
MVRQFSYCIFLFTKYKSDNWFYITKQGLVPATGIRSKHVPNRCVGSTPIISTLTWGERIRHMHQQFTNTCDLVLGHVLFHHHRKWWFQQKLFWFGSRGHPVRIATRSPSNITDDFNGDPPSRQATVTQQVTSDFVHTFSISLPPIIRQQTDVYPGTPAVICRLLLFGSSPKQHCVGFMKEKVVLSTAAVSIISPTFHTHSCMSLETDGLF